MKSTIPALHYESSTAPCGDLIIAMPNSHSRLEETTATELALKSFCLAERAWSTKTWTLSHDPERTEDMLFAEAGDRGTRDIRRTWQSPSHYLSLALQKPSTVEPELLGNANDYPLRIRSFTGLEYMLRGYGTSSAHAPGLKLPLPLCKCHLPDAHTQVIGNINVDRCYQNQAIGSAIFYGLLLNMPDDTPLETSVPRPELALQQKLTTLGFERSESDGKAATLANGIAYKIDSMVAPSASLVRDKLVAAHPWLHRVAIVAPLGEEATL